METVFLVWLRFDVPALCLIASLIISDQLTLLCVRASISQKGPEVAGADTVKELTENQYVLHLTVLLQLTTTFSSFMVQA